MTQQRYESREYDTTVSADEARDWTRASIDDYTTQQSYQHIQDMHDNPIILSDDMSYAQIYRQIRRMRRTGYMHSTASDLAEEFGISMDMAIQIHAILHDEEGSE